MAELATAALDAMVEQVRDGRLPAENCIAHGRAPRRHGEL
jgi:hypothetical protein